MLRIPQLLKLTEREFWFWLYVWFWGFCDFNSETLLWRTFFTMSTFNDTVYFEANIYYSFFYFFLLAYWRFFGDFPPHKNYFLHLVLV